MTNTNKMKIVRITISVFCIVSDITIRLYQCRETIPGGE